MTLDIDRITKLLKELADYPHGKDGQHYHHSLTDANHAEVLAVLELLVAHSSGIQPCLGS